MTTLIHSLPSERALPGRDAVREHFLLAAIVAAYYGVAKLICRIYPALFHESWDILGYLSGLAMGLVFTLCGYTIFVMLFRRPKRLIAYLGTHLRQYLTTNRIVYALPVLAMLPVFASSFTVVKAAIPLLHPYAWDVRLADIDAALHGGVQPWAWLNAVLDKPLLTFVINFNYHLWFFIMFGMIYWLAFAVEHARLRMQFLLSFVIAWILFGNVLATLLSSVGPCYYGRMIGGPDPYAGLMAYLHEANRQFPVWALTVQDLLWQGYHEQQGEARALAISAMPSMHVSSSVLLALLGWRLHRLAGIALTAFAVVIMVGSVHLGWHYAIDGYVGALGAWLVWHAVQRCPWLPEEHDAGSDDGAAAEQPRFASATR